jgi:hypothetical protein
VPGLVSASAVPMLSILMDINAVDAAHRQTKNDGWMYTLSCRHPAVEAAHSSTVRSLVDLAGFSRCISGTVGSTVTVDDRWGE